MKKYSVIVVEDEWNKYILTKAEKMGKTRFQYLKMLEYFYRVNKNKINGKLN